MTSNQTKTIAANKVPMAGAKGGRRSGFTLVELLVVIGIIAVLISILLPSLSKARKAANSLVCASSMRQISTFMIMYTTQYKGAIPGNGWTSGAFLKTPKSTKVIPYGDANCPEICQTWDWMAPVAKLAGLKFNVEKGTADRTARFDTLCRAGMFQCPENDIVVAPYSGSPIKISTRMVPYVTSSIFQYAYDPDSSKDLGLYQSFINTGSYRPKINHIGNASQKIWLAEGARWTNGLAVAPDYNLTFDGGGTPGGQYSDYGPWSQFTRSYLTKGDYSVTNPLTYSMRHGGRSKKGKIGELRFNVAFFDGHVETLDGRTGMNPSLWMPKGTLLTASDQKNEMNAEAFNWYGSSTNRTID